MTRRPAYDPQPGVAAKRPGWCPRCDREVVRGDRIYFQRGEATHCACAPGADDD